MASGEPGFPWKFIWRDREYTVDRLIEKWKQTADCRDGSRERYVRRHWYRVKVRGGEEMNIYFERHARSFGQRKVRWWLYSISSGEE